MIDFCILGSGISGSTIANVLSKKYKVKILDKARGIGGRSSNNKITSKISFDHGLQYFNPESKNFRKFLTALIKKKIVKYWGGNHLDLSIKSNPHNKKIIGTNGNNDISKFLLKNVNKELGIEITKLEFKKKYWILKHKNKKIISKNIILTFPFEQVKSIAKNHIDKKLLKLKVNMDPNITLLVVENNKNYLPISSIKFNNKILAWAANENSKMRFLNNKTLWTIQANKIFSKKVINIYKKKRKYFSNIILKEFTNVTGLNIKKFKIIKIHGWKYSYSNSKTKYKSYWDPKKNLGICGDWFIGPKAESAWLSAHNLWSQIKKTRLKKIFRRAF